MNDLPKSHRLNPRIRAMKCIRCKTLYPVDDYFNGCPCCQGTGDSSSLTFQYDGPAYILSKHKGLHRYSQFLPYEDTVTLGEGNTPVLKLPALAKELGVAKLYTKNEFQNPTGSHKDRMNPFITARASEAGYHTVTCASSGNEAASLAAYAAAEGLTCVNVSTKGIPLFWENASIASGAQLVLTDTPALRLEYQKKKMKDGWYCATNLQDNPTSSSPFGIQGYKTIAFELYEELGTDLPNYIFIPTCRGDLLYGIYEGFQDLINEKFLDFMPHLVACEPFPRLELVLTKGHDYKEKFSGDSSYTSSIGGNTATYQSICALKGSNGFAVSAPDADIYQAVKSMGRHGLFLETSSAIVYPCLQNALMSGLIASNDSVLFILTSNGYKNKQAL